MQAAAVPGVSAGLFNKLITTGPIGADEMLLGLKEATPGVLEGAVTKKLPDGITSAVTKKLPDGITKTAKRSTGTVIKATKKKY